MLAQCNYGLMPSARIRYQKVTTRPSVKSHYLHNHSLMFSVPKCEYPFACQQTDWLWPINPAVWLIQKHYCGVQNVLK